jgi:hypothetical protein
MIRFLALTLICTASMFGTFTFAFRKKSIGVDSWTEYGWPLTFLKRFSENDFYIGNHYFYTGNLLLNILFCFCLSLLAMLLVYAIRYITKEKTLIAD